MSQAPSCTVNWLCVGALLVFVGSILLCALGFTVLLPYEATRHWPQVTCRVLNASYNRRLCTCQRQLTHYEPCTNKYPCLQVHVLYMASLLPPNTSHHGTRHGQGQTEVTQTEEHGAGSYTEGSTAGDVMAGHTQGQDETAAPTLNTTVQQLTTSTDHKQVVNATHTSHTNYSHPYLTESTDALDSELSSLYENQTLAKFVTEMLSSPSYTSTQRNQSVRKADTSTESPLSNMPSTDGSASPSGQRLSTSTTDMLIRSDHVTWEAPSGGGDEVVMTAMLYRSWSDAFYKKVTNHNN